MTMFFACLPVLIVIALLLFAIYRELNALNRLIAEKPARTEGVLPLKSKGRRATRLSDKAEKWLSTRGVEAKEVR